MNDGDLEAIRREHRQRLFDRYQNEAGAFSRLFTALLVFSAFFLAFALVPYAVLQHNRQVLAQSIYSRCSACGRLGARSRRSRPPNRPRADAAPRRPVEPTRDAQRRDS